MAKRWVRAAVYAALCMFSAFVPGLLAAQEVSLRFPDGSFEVTGPLLGFDGLSYRLDTRFGVLTIKADQVECVGDCPTDTYAPLIRMSGTEALGEVLIPAMVDAFALSLGLQSTVEPATDGAVRLALLSDGVPIARFEIARMSTTDAIAALFENRADIVLSDRFVTTKEAERSKTLGFGDLEDPLRRRLLARRPLRLVTSEPPPPFTVTQLAQVLAGQISDWSALGASPEPIKLFTTGMDHGPLAARLAELEAVLSLPSTPLAQLAVLDGPEALRVALEATPGAIAITHEPDPFGHEVALSHGCLPGTASRAEGTAHPLMVHYWAYTGAARLPDLGRAFLMFASGPDAQRVVDRAGFIDKRPRPVPLAEQGDRLAQAVAAAGEEVSLLDLQTTLRRLQGYDRLELSFRFREGEPELLTESVSEAQGLAALLDTGAFDGRSLLFLGLTDSMGDAEANARLAQVRATRAANAVMAAMATNPARVVMQSEGFGETLPIACDDTRWGQHVNRRVEVWVGPHTR